jgi:2-dehydro-3-deoxyglucarate aldolase/4-hydroxy-2-oxoheptanedioate aldolase
MPRGFARHLSEAATCQWGTWVKIPALETIEMIAAAGLDFIVLDQEHAPMGMESAYRATVVAQGLGLQVLTRVPDRSGSHLQRLLDSGVDGILVPRVGGAAQAREVVSQMVFSPSGDRGLGITARAGSWGGISREEYVRAGDAVLRAVQLEDVGALDDVEGILAAPGLNGLFLGMGDLSLSSGRGAGDPETAALVARMLAAANAAGVPCGTAVQTAAQAHAAADSGFRFVMVGNDAGLFREAVGRLGADLRTAAGARS